MNRKGQTGTEMFLVVSAVLVFLLIVAVTAAQRNDVTRIVSKVNEEIQQCETVASLITKIGPGNSYIETKFSVDTDMHVEKGNIIVGNNGCYYADDIRLETAEGIYTGGQEGFDLLQGTEYKIKKLKTGVVFCDTIQDWC